MKKIFAVIAVATMLVACGTKTTNTETVEATDSVEVVVDSAEVAEVETVADTVVAVAE